MIIDNMNFFNLNGSIIFFCFIWIIILLISKFLIKLKNIYYLIIIGIDII